MGAVDRPYNHHLEVDYLKHYKTCDIDDCLICDSWYREIRETDKPKQELTKIQLTYWTNQTTRLSDYE